MVPVIKGISPNLQQGMTWLAKTFSESLHDPAQDKEDIYQDLVVFFLERQNKAPKNLKNPDNYWFRLFKNSLIDRARRSRLEPNSIKAALDKNPYDTNND